MAAGEGIVRIPMYGTRNSSGIVELCFIATLELLQRREHFQNLPLAAGGSQRAEHSAIAKALSALFALALGFAMALLKAGA